MISANGGLPAHRYTPQVTPRWPRGSELASVDQMYKMQATSDDDGLGPVRRKVPIGMHKWADLYDWAKAEFRDLPPHRRGRDHRIRLDSEDNPPRVHPYRMDQSQLDELRRQLDKLHQSGQIRPSSSPYAASCLLVKKAHGKWRMCVDYRASNTRPVRDRYPLPSIQSILSTLGVGSSYCHALVGGLDPGQAALKTLLLMLRLT